MQDVSYETTPRRKQKIVLFRWKDSTSKCSSADMSIISKQEQQSTCNDPASQQTSLNYSPNLTLVDALEVCGFKYGRDDTTESRCGIKDASKEAIEDVYNSLDMNEKVQVMEACLHSSSINIQFDDKALFFGYELPLHQLFAEAFYNFGDWSKVQKCIENLPVEVSRWALTRQDGENAWIPLHFAVASHSVPFSLIELIISIAPLSVAMSNVDGLCSLHIAAYYGSTSSVIEMLALNYPYGVVLADFDCATPFERSCIEEIRFAMMRGFIRGCCERKFYEHGSLVKSSRGLSEHPFHLILEETAYGYWSWSDILTLLDALPKNNLFLIYALEMCFGQSIDCTLDIALADRAPIKVIEKLFELAPNAKRIIEQEKKTALEVAVTRKGILWSKGSFSKVLSAFHVTKNDKSEIRRKNYTIT